MNIHNVNAVAAISGGADSACMAYLLKKQGYHVGGIYLRMFDSNEADQALQDAVKIADLLAIPFEVIDVRGKFDKEIVQPFTCDYLSGLTPNPCLRCNPLIKWNQMVVHLDLKPHQYIATGHYAIIDRSTGKFPTLRRSPFKDQSYFLSRLTRKNIKRTLLPIGQMQKSEVREILQHAGIPCASKPDSQEICFITRGKYADYIENRLPHRIPSPGDIIDVNGKKLGRHKGLHRYTIGQRQGLGISARYPLYVVEMDPTTNVLVVGSKTDATRYSFRVINPVWSAIDSPVDAFVCEVQIRYRHTPVAAKIHPLDDGSVRVELIDKPAIIAPGQGAAFYRGDLVLGGGEIRI